MKNKLALVLMIVGALMMLASVGMTMYQDHEETVANETVMAVTDDVQQAVQKNAAFLALEPRPEEQPVADEASTGVDTPVVAIVATTGGSAEPTIVPDPIMAADEAPQTMPIVYVDGKAYIGMLTIPSLELDLPIQEQWSYAKLKQTPCHYSGTVYEGNLVLIAHNYDRHFGRLSTLKQGDSVLFTDANGMVYYFEVEVLETLQPNQNDYLTSGLWDLSLSTCTIGGRQRNVVRCRRVDPLAVP